MTWSGSTESWKISDGDICPWEPQLERRVRSQAAGRLINWSPSSSFHWRYRTVLLRLAQAVRTIYVCKVSLPGYPVTDDLVLLAKPWPVSPELLKWVEGAPRLNTGPSAGALSLSGEEGGSKFVAGVGAPPHRSSSRLPPCRWFPMRG